MSYNERRRINPLVIIILAAIVIVAVVILFMISYRTVGAGEIGIVTEWGKPVYQVGEGLTIINPIWGDLIKMDIKTQRVDQKATAASGDLQNVVMELAVNYHLDSSKTFNLYQTIGLDYKNRVIVPAVQEIVKQVTAKHTAQQIVTQREEIKIEIQNALDKRLAVRGIVVENVNIINVDFSASFNEAIEATTTQKQNELKEKNILSVVMIQQQQKKIQAEANYNVTVTNAKALADKNVIEATGQADAITKVTETLKDNPEYILYLQSQRWNGQLPMINGGGETSDGLANIILDSDTLKDLRGNVTAPSANATLP